LLKSESPREPGAFSRHPMNAVHPPRSTTDQRADRSVPFGSIRRGDRLICQIVNRDQTEKRRIVSVSLPKLAVGAEGAVSVS
jgi:hypothetical protein